MTTTDTQQPVTELTHEEVDQLIALSEQLKAEVVKLEKKDQNDPQVQADKAALNAAIEVFNARVAKAKQTGSQQDVAAAVEQALKVSAIIRDINDRLDKVENALFVGEDGKPNLVKSVNSLMDDFYGTDDDPGLAKDVEELQTKVAGFTNLFEVGEDGTPKISKAVHAHAVVLHGTPAQGDQPAQAGLVDRVGATESDIATLKSDVEQLKSGGNAGSFSVGMFLLVTIVGAVIGGFVGFIFDAWIMAAMVGAFIGAVIGYAVASGKVKKSKKNQPEPAPAQS